MAGNFIAALKQIKYGVDRVDKGNPYLFLNAPLEVSDAIFPRSLHGFCETPEIAACPAILSRFVYELRRARKGHLDKVAFAGRDSIFARRYADVCPMPIRQCLA